MTEIFSMTIGGESLNFLGETINNFITPDLSGFADSSLDDSCRTLKYTHYSMIVVVVILLCLILFNYKHVFFYILQHGIIETLLTYPVFSIIGIVLHTVNIIYKIDQRAMESINTIHNYGCTKCKKKQLMSKEKNTKFAWNDIAETCGETLESVFNNIIENFRNDEINEIFDNPLSKHLTIDDEQQNDIIDSVKKTLNLDMKKWKQNIEKIKEIFSDKFKRFKEIENLLINLKTKINELKNWTESTKSLFKTFDDNNEIKQNVEVFVKQKINNMKYPDLIDEYQRLYLELKVLLGYMSDNPETEMVSKCPICLTNLKDSFVVPCGHCACKSCFDQQFDIDKRIICPICRTHGTKIGKLFY